jgi:hypothetical protein
MATTDDTAQPLPHFVAASPPITLPPGRTLGAVVGVAVSADKHIWVLHIASQLEWGAEDGRDAGARLPSIVEFDADGNFVNAWGGPDHLPRIEGKQQWPKQEETISIDAEGTIWLFGADTRYDHAVQRFTRDGKLLLRIGAFDSVGHDQSPDRPGCPTDAYHDVARREVYITDGYVNHRVAVFNSDTGAFLRSWGAYGVTPPPVDADREGFNNPVHAISLGPDGYLYICDRKNNRIQVFDAIGRKYARFIREIEIDVPSPFGSTFNVAFSPDGQFMFVSDGSNSRLWTVDLQAWKIVSSFPGPNSEGADLTATIHKIATDAQGNLLLGRCARGLEKMCRE